MQNVVVTGGAGFIGSHICDVLLSKNYRVYCIDNLSSGSLNNVKHNFTKENFIFKEFDILDREKLMEVAETVDVVIHLAAYKIPRYSSAMKTLLINSEGTKNSLELARIKKAKFLISSTSDVYGKNPQMPFFESGDLVLGPSTSRRWAYAVSKLFDEHLTMAYQDEYNLEVVILRYFGTYGERQYLNWWGGPQGVFLDAIFNNNSIDIHGDGRQTRCFSYVKETAEATVSAMEKVDAVGEIINIGTNEEISIMELAKLIHRVSGVPNELKYNFIKYEEFSKNYEDVTRRIPSLQKMHQLLNYESKITLENGITKLVAWYKANYLSK